MQPKIGIVILNWNNWQDTINCVSQISQLDYSEDCIEIFVVDNGSTDDSVQQLMNLENVFVISLNHNLGFASGTNVGLEEAIHKNCDFLLVLNNDTVLPPSFLKPLVEKITQSKSIGIVSPKILESDNPDIIWYAGGYFQKFRILGGARGDKQHDNGQWDENCSVDFAFGCCMLIRRELLEQIGLFDESFFFFHEDMDLCYRTIKAGFSIWYVPESFLYHKISKSTENLLPLRVYLLIQARMIFFFKHIRGINIFIVFFLEIIRAFRHFGKYVISHKPELARNYFNGMISGIKKAIEYKIYLDANQNVTLDKSKWRILYRLLGWSFFLFVIGFLSKRAIDGFQLLRDSSITFEPKYLALSFTCHMLSYVVAGGIWSNILRKLNVRSDYKFDLAAFSLSALGRKIPGLIVYAVSRLLIYGARQVPKAPVILGMVVETTLLSLAALISMIYVTSRVKLPVGWFGRIDVLIIILITIIIFLGLAGPRIIRFFTKFSKVKDAITNSESNYSVFSLDTVKWLLAELIVIILASGMIFFFMKSIFPDNNIPHYTILISFAIPVFIAPIATWLPGDLGIRDGLMYLLIIPFVDPSIAALLTLTTRVWISALEIIYGIVAGIYINRIIDLRKIRKNFNSVQS
jgi:GT2 family glycosyltransferase